MANLLNFTFTNKTATRSLKKLHHEFDLRKRATDLISCLIEVVFINETDISSKRKGYTDFTLLIQKPVEEKLG